MSRKKEKTKRRERKLEKSFGGDKKYGWDSGTDSNLYLDKEIKALPNLSIRKNGKEVPVNVQISDYLKSMGLLENISLADIIFESIDNIISEGIEKRRYKGKTYKSPSKMIRAVIAHEEGKISHGELIKVAEWAENPRHAIEVSRIVARIRPYK
jgi:hypothetical protein